MIIMTSIIINKLDKDRIEHAQDLSSKLSDLYAALSHQEKVLSDSFKKDEKTVIWQQTQKAIGPSSKVCKQSNGWKAVNKLLTYGEETSVVNMWKILTNVTIVNKW